ncbi:MAG: c-type cytochrome biogenesis protein CcmI [Rhodocyclaceae bacterium]|nr:c-type cytochrome biogenesis protein CcmI [Rhodocyclaceae bacterium]
MTPFLIGAALLVAIGLGLLLWPLHRTGRTGTAATASRRQMNVAIYRDHMAELDIDRTDGDLDEADWKQARQELQRRLLDDGDDGTAAPAVDPQASRSIKGLAIALTTAIPIVAAALYLLLGSPAGLNPPSAEYVPSTAEIEAMVEQSLKNNPDNKQALWFAGMIAFEREDFGKAVEHWERLKKQLPPESEDAQSIARSIEEARAGANATRGPKP